MGCTPSALPSDQFLCDGEKMSISSGIKAMRLMVALRKRIQRVADTGDPAEVLNPQAVAQAQRLLGMTSPALGLEIAWTVGYLHWMRYNELPPGEGEADARIATEMFAEVFRADPSRVPPEMRVYLEQNGERRQSSIRMVPPAVLMSWTRMKRFQELTASDFRTWHPDERRPLICVSHRWITKGHPDPDGLQLRELQQRLRGLLNEDPRLAECGVFYDYWSMPQKPCTPEENETLQQEINRLAELFSAADRVIILSEGYTDYRSRAWCFFEAVASITATLDYQERPQSNVYFFPDQESIVSDLAFLHTTMFQTMLGHQVKFRTSHDMRYKPDMKGAEVIAAVFHYLLSCRTTDPADHPLIRRQLVAAMNRSQSVTPYGRLLLGINKYFDTAYCVFTEKLTPLAATLHFEQPQWPRIPAFHQSGQREATPGPFCLAPEQVDVLAAEGGSSFSALRLSSRVHRDVNALVDTFRNACGWEEFYIPSYELINPPGDLFPTMDHLMHTVLELGPAPLFQPPGDPFIYFPLVDPAR